MQGSVRKKGKKWYFRFYIEDQNGNRVQTERVGTESKAETESMLRKALQEYEHQQFVAKARNVTLANLLDSWINEEVYVHKKSSGTVSSYINTVNRIKKHAISKRKLNSIKTEHLQHFFDTLSSSHKLADKTSSQGLSASTLKIYAAVMRSAFKFAVFPKQFITFNPMQHVSVLRCDITNFDLFETENEVKEASSVITNVQFSEIENYLKTRNIPSLLAFQIGYFTGLRLGEVCAIAWSDINLEKRCLIVRRSIAYSNICKCHCIGTTKSKKKRTIFFGEKLAKLLNEAKLRQAENRDNYKNLYSQNYYTVEKINNRTFYTVHTLSIEDELDAKYKYIDLVCIRPNGAFISQNSISSICRAIAKRVAGLENFHFHKLRHTYTTNLLDSGVSVKDVQELLGHADATTTMNIYAHSSDESKQKAALLLDKDDP